MGNANERLAEEEVRRIQNPYDTTHAYYRQNYPSLAVRMTTRKCCYGTHRREQRFFIRLADYVHNSQCRMDASWLIN